MERKLEVLITSGGTISKIDDIRHIGNFSNGTTGALIAEEFLKNNWKVYYLYGKNAVRPFRRNLSVNPERDFDAEVDRLKKVYGEFNEYKNNLIEHPFFDFDHYYNSVRELLTRNKMDAVVLVAAVGDYGIKKMDGKISSDKEELILRMTKNPKVISKIKKWDRYVFQVGFKLLSNVDDKELIETAYKHGIKNDSDLTVANSMNIKGSRKSSTYIIFPEKEVIPVERKNLASKLVYYLRKNLYYIS